MSETDPNMVKAAREWLKSRDLIKQALREMVPELSEGILDHNAAAIIARLSHANMLIVDAEDVKG